MLSRGTCSEGGGDIKDGVVKVKVKDVVSGLMSRMGA